MISTNKRRLWGAVLLFALLLGYFAYERFSSVVRGSTTLTWIAPIQNEADEPINNLAGYDIHCWGDEGRYSNTIRINDPATTRYEIKGLAPGIYQCAVSAFNEDGDESVLSNVVARVLPPRVF